MRLHLFELEDQPWFPDVIRNGGTDYLRYLLIATEVYKPCIILLNETLKQTGETRIVDLCSGGGGYAEQVCNELNKNTSGNICLLYTSPSPRDRQKSRMPSS